VRFPNVEELYNGTVTATSITLSDPNLRAERSDALELSAEKEWEHQRLRVSLFHDDVRDAILRQSDTTVTPTKSPASPTSTGSKPKASSSSGRRRTGCWPGCRWTPTWRWPIPR
jgi:outer membrane receptor protein involved in Fe transport